MLVALWAVVHPAIDATHLGHANEGLGEESADAAAIDGHGEVQPGETRRYSTKGTERRILENTWI